MAYQVRAFVRGIEIIEIMTNNKKPHKYFVIQMIVLFISVFKIFKQYLNHTLFQELIVFVFLKKPNAVCIFKVMKIQYYVTTR